MIGQLTTTSGIKIKFTHVKLYNALHIRHVQSLQSKAETKAIPLASPYGALGGFAFVTSVIAANMLAEHVINAARSKDADSLFGQSFDLAEKIRDLGEFVAVNLVSKIEVPLPSVWRATIQKTIKESKTVTGSAEVKTISATMIHNGDPFVVLRCQQGDVSVFWDKVESYCFGSCSD